MNKIVDTLIVAAMLMTSVPSLADEPVLTLAPAHEQPATQDTLAADLPDEADHPLSVD